MSGFLRKIIVIFGSFILLAAAFGGGYFFAKFSQEPQIIFGVANPESGQPESADFSLFWQAWAALENKFVNKDKLDFQKMIYGAISGMVKSLEDPYTVFFPPEESKRFNEDVKGSFEGVGMEIDIKKGQLLVVSPLEGTPAQAAGLKAGDKILAVNGTSTVDLTIEEAVRMIRGPKGSEVTLTIIRDDWDKSKEIKIVRDVIKVPSIKLETKDESVAYLKIYQFSEQAGWEFRKAAIEILNSGNKKIVLDLRNNPGGYLEVAQDIAGWFLEKGEVVAIEDFGEKREQSFYNAQGPSLLLSHPVVVLINQGSASASEILAGALRDNRGIKLIGEKSFGKGSVQELENLREGSSLKITVAKWLTPKGAFITDVGLDPDVKIEITDNDLEAGKDPQLDKALEIIREIE